METAPVTQWIAVWVGPRIGVNDPDRTELPGMEARMFGRPASSLLSFCCSVIILLTF